MLAGFAAERGEAGLVEMFKGRMGEGLANALAARAMRGFS